MRVHRPVHVIIDVGEALEVNPAPERGEGADPLMERIRAEMEAMLERSGKETKPLPPAPAPAPGI